MAGDPTAGASFAEELAALKRRGATVLVRGGDDADRPVCESLLGDDAAGRRRLVVETGPGHRHAHRSLADDVVRVDVAAGDVRSAAAVPAAGSTAAGRAGSATDLATLTTRVYEAIDGLGGDDLAPGDLRLCGGDLTPLVAAAGTPAVRRYLQLLSARAVAVGGLAHVHLPGGTAVEASLSPLFDVLVELRRGFDGERQQRWRLQSSGLETGWLPLDVS